MSFTPKVRSLAELKEAARGMKAKLNALADEELEACSVYREMESSLATLAWAMGAEHPDGRSIVPSDEYITIRKSLW